MMQYEESVFWRIIEINKNIKISNDFFDFFHLLVSPKKIILIDDLLDNFWLNEVKANQQTIEKNFKEEFKNKYIFLSQAKKLVNNYKNNLDSIIEMNDINETLV